MSENQELRFAHNQHVQDDLFFQNSVSLFIPKSIPMKHNYVVSRAKVMLTSGLFWFWEKWHKIRFPRCLESGEKLLEDTEPVMALSMNSSVVLIFRVLLGSSVIKSINLEPFTRKLTDCILRIVQLAEPLNYSKIETPFILNNYHAAYYLPNNQIDARLSSNVSIFKVRNLYCKVHVIIADVDIPHDTTKDIRPQLSYLVRTIVRLTKDILASDVVLIFRQNPGEDQYLKHFRVNVFETSPLYIPILVIFPMSFSGFYMCWYDEDCHRYFTCLPNNCWETIQMAHSLGSQLRQYSAPLTLVNDLTTTKFYAHRGLLISKYFKAVRRINGFKLGSPFQQVKPWRLFETTYKLLVDDLNFTKSFNLEATNRELIVLSLGGSGSENEKLYNYHSEFRVSRTPSLKFILSDGVTSVKLDFAVYTNPLDFATWMSFLVANILFALILTMNALKFKNPKVFDEFTVATLALLGNFVEQGSLDRTIKYMSKSTRIVLMVSLLSGVVLTNGFKGFLKSYFGFGNKFVTNWRYFEELENFTLYFPRRDFSAKTQTYGNMVDDSSTCSVNCWAFSAHIVYNNGVDQTKFEGVFTNITQRLHFKCVNHNYLNSFFKEELMKPKTAFVMYKYEFTHYWNLVKTKMRENQELRFAHNHHVQDDLFLQNSVSLFIPKSIPMKHNYVVSRAKVMLTSGLFWFWRVEDATLKMTRARLEAEKARLEEIDSSDEERQNLTLDDDDGKDKDFVEDYLHKSPVWNEFHGNVLTQEEYSQPRVSFPETPPVTGTEYPTRTDGNLFRGENPFLNLESKDVDHEWSGVNLFGGPTLRDRVELLTLAKPTTGKAVGTEMVPGKSTVASINSTGHLAPTIPRGTQYLAPASHTMLTTDRPTLLEPPKSAQTPGWYPTTAPPLRTKAPWMGQFQSKAPMTFQSNVGPTYPSAGQSWYSVSNTRPPGTIPPAIPKVPSQSQPIPPATQAVPAGNDLT
ncbi:unnamed protein product, partial [Allacma fusca]